MCLLSNGVEKKEASIKSESYLSSNSFRSRSRSCSRIRTRSTDVVGRTLA